MDLADQLGVAISERRIITFRYAGTDFRVHPYLIRETDTGDLALGGTTEFGGWREFSLHEITPPKVVDPAFQPRSDYDSKGAGC